MFVNGGDVSIVDSTLVNASAVGLAAQGGGWYWGVVLTAEQLVVATVGKMDAKKRIEDAMTRLMSANIVQALGTMLDTVVF